jgi:hypothetical protein
VLRLVEVVGWLRNTLWKSLRQSITRWASHAHVVHRLLRLASTEQSSADSGIAHNSSIGNALSTHCILLTLNKQVEDVFILAGVASRVQSGCECLLVVDQSAAGVE